MASIFDRIRQKAQQALQSWQDRPSNQIFNTAKNAVTDYFKPTPQVRTRDIVRELPGAAVEVGRDYFVRPVAQSIASLGLTAREKMGGSGTTTPEEIAQGLPNKPVRDFIFGDQLPSSLQEQTRRNSPMVEDLLKRGGATPDFASKASVPLTFAGVTALTGLNAIPDDPTDLVRAGTNILKPKNLENIENLIQPTIKEAQQVQGLLSAGDQTTDLAKILSGDPVVPLPRRPKTTMYTTPEGVTIRPNKQPTTVEGLDKLLAQADEALNPSSVDNILGPQKLIAGGESPILLPQPSRSLTITQLEDAVKKGYNLDGVTLNAKNADEARKALGLGLTKDQIKFATKEVKEGATLFAGDEAIYKSLNQADEDALKTVVEDNNFNVGNRLSRFGRKFRDTEDSLRKTFGDLYDSKIAPIIEAHTKRLGDEARWIKSYQDRLVNLNVAPGSQDDKLIRLFQDKNGFAKVEAQVGTEKAKALEQTYSQLRQMYDEILDQVNASRQSAGLSLIPKKENFLSQVGGNKGGNMLDAILEGGAERTDPLSQTIFKKQTKDATTGAIESMTDYLNYAGRAGFSDLTANEYTTLSSALKKAGTPQEATAQLDTLAEDILGTGPKGNLEKVIDKYTGKVRQAAVLGKVGTLVNQFLTAPQAFFSAGPVNTIKGAFSQEAKNAVNASDFIAAVGKSTPKELRGGSWFNKAIGMNGDALLGAQQSANKFVWKAFFEQGRGKGLGVEDAIKFADQITPKLVGDRRLGMTPEVYNTLFGRIFGAFTIEPTAAVTRVLDQAAVAVKGNPKAAAEVLGTVLGWHYLNKLNERYGTGYSPYPDLPQAISDSVEYATGSDTKEKSNVRSMGRIFSELLQLSPTMNNVFNTAYSLGETAGVVPNSKDVFGEGDNTWMNVGSLYNPLDNATRNVTGNKLIDYPANVAANFVPGVEQILKTTQAARSLKNGAVESRSGKITFEAPKNPVDKVRSLIFGQYSTPEAKKYFGSDYSRPLTENQTKAYWSLPEDKRTKFLENSQTSSANSARLQSKTKSVDSILSGNADPSGITPKTAQEQKDLKAYVSTILDGGSTPDQTDIKNAIFNGKSATSKSIEERMDVYKSLNTAMSNENYSDEQKQAILAASGAPKEESDYYVLASKDQDVRLQELLPKLDNMESREVVKFLMQGRRAVGGKQLINNAMVDYLYENDYIDENAKDAVKALKYDEITGKFYFSKSFAKKGKGDLTYNEAKKLFNMELPKYQELKGISNLLKTYSPGSGTQTGSLDETLISSILSRKSSPSSSGNKLWFNK